MKSEKITFSLEETETFAKAFAQNLGKVPTVVALHGDLGAGKTAFVRGMCHSRSDVSLRDVSSPTFSYLNIYGDASFPIYHFDLYRLKNQQDFVLAGFEEYLETPSWCLIEWPDIILPLLPSTTLHIHLAHLGEEQRKISWRQG